MLVAVTAACESAIVGVDPLVVVIVNGVVVVILNGLIPLTLIACGNGTGCVADAGDKRVGVGVCHP